MTSTATVAGTETDEPQPERINLDALKKRNLTLKEINKLIRKIKKQQKDESSSEILMETIPPKPTLPILDDLTFDDKLLAIQDYITSFEYNLTTMQLSTYQKRKTFASMVDYAKILIKQSLPIKCLDGFILAAYLTRNIDKHCIRFPLRFLSKCGTKLYWHIVLGVMHSRTHQFGAIGISRKNDKLSFKQCRHDSLMDLIYEYIDCYQCYNHRVKMVTVGVPLTVDEYSEDPIFWDILEIHNMDKGNDIESHQESLDALFSNFFKRRDIVFRSLTEENKPFIFDAHVIYENGKYLLKEQHKKEKKMKLVEPDAFDEFKPNPGEDGDLHSKEIDQCELE